jgi:hypothetical protein
MSRSGPRHDQVFAVLRLDSDLTGEHAITLKEVVWELATAEAEVARLNTLNGDKGVRYFWQATRLYPKGQAASDPPGVDTTEPGYRNRNNQVVVRSTGLPGNDHLQSIYVLRCRNCENEYGANGSDIHLRRCPSCQGGAAGLAY